MIANARTVVAVLVLTALAGAAGGWFGVHYGVARQHSSTSLNRLLHRQLHLSADQRQRLAALEARYDTRRRLLESQARAANRELAAALLADHQYGPKDEQAINDFYAAMKALQVATAKHVLAMRAVLTPQQAQKFDRTVSRALDSGRP